MSVNVRAGRTVPGAADAVLRGVASDRLDPPPDGIDGAVLGPLGFEGKPGQVQVLPDADGRLTALVGLGETDSIDAHTVRRAAASGARALTKAAKVATTLVADVDGLVDATAASQAIVEGVRLGTYVFDRHKPSATPSALRQVTVVGGVRRAVERGEIVADAVCLARDLVNEPGGTLTPPVFAERAAEAAKAAGVRARVMTEAAIRRAGMGGLLGVNRGSTQPPRFVELTWRPPSSNERRQVPVLALVGKGITFDSGGLDIKPAAGMLTMKCDMGGAAAVIGAMSAIGRLGPDVEVRAYLPMTDNMTGGDATRPGDVLVIRNGKTVEIGNTDAEGRLILADAISLASEAEPDAIVDLATLTGACMVALGDRIAGLMSTHDGLADQIREAAQRAGEQVWRLPLPPEYRKQLDSPVADLKNVGGSYAGALTAGLFLKEFVGEGIAWAHLDIAGPAFVDADDAEITKGGVGYGVRTLVELATSFRAP